MLQEEGADDGRVGFTPQQVDKPAKQQVAGPGRPLSDGNESTGGGATAPIRRGQRASTRFSFISPMQQHSALQPQQQQPAHKPRRVANLDDAAGDLLPGASASQSPIAARAARASLVAAPATGPMAPRRPATPPKRQVLDAVVGIVAVEVSAAVLAPDVFDANNGLLVPEPLDIEMDSPLVVAEAVEVEVLSSTPADGSATGHAPATFHRRQSIAVQRTQASEVAKVRVGRRQNAMTVNISQPQTVGKAPQVSLQTMQGNKRTLPASRKDRINAIVEKAMQAGNTAAGGTNALGGQIGVPRRSVIERMVDAALSTGDRTADRAAELTAKVQKQGAAGAGGRSSRGPRLMLCFGSRGDPLEEAALVLLEEAIAPPTPSPGTEAGGNSRVLLSRRGSLPSSAGHPHLPGVGMAPLAGLHRRAGSESRKVIDFAAEDKGSHAAAGIDAGDVQSQSSRLISVSRRSSVMQGTNTGRLAFAAQTMRPGSRKWDNM